MKPSLSGHQIPNSELLPPIPSSHSVGSIPSPVRGLWSGCRLMDNHSLSNACSNRRNKLRTNNALSIESVFNQLGVSPINPNMASVNTSENKPARWINGAAGSQNGSGQPRLIKMARKSLDNLEVSRVTQEHDIHLKVNPEVLAQQITLCELQYFKAIRPEELTSLKWNGKEKLKYAPNIVASTRWFNQLIFWVQKDILNETTLSKRAEIMSHFIRIAKKLIDSNNYGSAMAIVSGLQVQCIYRLSATWSTLSSRDRTQFRKLADIFAQENNHTNLRSAVDNSKLPCIPYLGLYLGDLTYIDVAASTMGTTRSNAAQANSTWNAQGKLNRIDALLSKIQRLQTSSYPYVRNEKIINYLESQRYIDELQNFIENANYKTSLALEPPPSTEGPTPGATTQDFSRSNSSATKGEQLACVAQIFPVKPGTTPHHSVGRQISTTNLHLTKSATSTPPSGLDSLRYSTEFFIESSCSRSTTSTNSVNLQNSSSDQTQEAVGGRTHNRLKSWTSEYPNTDMESDRSQCGSATGADYLQPTTRPSLDYREGAPNRLFSATSVGSKSMMHIDDRLSPPGRAPPRLQKLKLRSDSTSVPNALPLLSADPNETRGSLECSASRLNSNHLDQSSPLDQPFACKFVSDQSGVTPARITHQPWIPSSTTSDYSPLALVALAAVRLWLTGKRCHLHSDNRFRRSMSIDLTSDSQYSLTSVECMDPTSDPQNPHTVCVLREGPLICTASSKLPTHRFKRHTITNNKQLAVLPMSISCSNLDQTPSPTNTSSSHKPGTIFLNPATLPNRTTKHRALVAPTLHSPSNPRITQFPVHRAKSDLTHRSQTRVNLSNLRWVVLLEWNHRDAFLVLFKSLKVRRHVRNKLETSDLCCHSPNFFSPTRYKLIQPKTVLVQTEPCKVLVSDTSTTHWFHKPKYRLLCPYPVNVEDCSLSCCMVGSRKQETHTIDSQTTQCTQTYHSHPSTSDVTIRQDHCVNAVDNPIRQLLSLFPS